MSYRNEDIARQLRLGEDSGWEFKQIEFSGNLPKSPRRDDLADEIAAFANGDGGVLLCGVTDQGEVQGMTRPQMDAMERLIVDICTDAIKPPVRPIILRKELEPEKPFLLMAVDREETQHFRWSAEQIVPDTGIGALEETLWKSLLSAEGAADPEGAMEKMGLLSRGDNGVLRATVAGVLLCSDAPEEWLPSACITATHYRGVDRASGHLDAQTITGPVSRQIAEAVAFAVRNMRVGAYKSPARIDLPQYSERALFEAIVNAVAHRDYSIRGRRIRLSMFADRIEINSPGRLPNDLTVDTVAIRQSTRNEALTSALGRLPVRTVRGAGDRRYFMERRGDGIPIMLRETYELSGRYPEFRLIGGSELCVSIPAVSLESSVEIVGRTSLMEYRPVG